MKEGMKPEQPDLENPKVREIQEQANTSKLDRGVSDNLSFWTAQESNVSTQNKHDDPDLAFEESLPLVVREASSQLVMSTLGPEVDKKEGRILLRLRKRDLEAAFLLLLAAIAIFVASMFMFASRETTTFSAGKRDDSKTCVGALGPGNSKGDSYEPPLLPCWPTAGYEWEDPYPDIEDYTEHLKWTNNGLWRWFLSSDEAPVVHAFSDRSDPAVDAVGQLYVRPVERPNFATTAVVPLGSALVTALTATQIVFFVGEEFHVDKVQKVVDPSAFSDTWIDPHGARPWVTNISVFEWFIWSAEAGSLLEISTKLCHGAHCYTENDDWTVTTEAGAILRASNITCLSRGENLTEFLLGRDDFICFKTESLTFGEILAQSLAVVSGCIAALAILANMILRRNML